MGRLAVFTPFYWPHIGGMELALYRICSALSKRDIEVTVYTSFETPHQENHPVRVVRVGYGLSEWADSLEAVVGHDPHTSYLFASLGPGTQQQQITLAKKHRANGGRSVWRVPTADHVSRNVSSFEMHNVFDLIVTNSFYSASETQNHLQTGRVVTIPNILLDDERQANLDILLSDRGVDIAWAGRIEPRKQPETIAHLLNRMVANNLTVAAQPVEAYARPDEYESFCRSLDPRIKLLPSSIGVTDAIQRASVVLHCSNREGSPNFLLEALDRGQGILASPIPECFELVGNAPQIIWIGSQEASDTSLIERLVLRSRDFKTRLEQRDSLNPGHYEKSVTDAWQQVLFQ